MFARSKNHARSILSDQTLRRSDKYRIGNGDNGKDRGTLCYKKACSRLIYQCTRLDKIIVRLRVPCALLGISLSRNSRKDESLPHGKYARRYLVFVSLRCRSTGRFCKADTHFTASLILETATWYFTAPLFSNPLRAKPHPAEMQKLVRIPAQSKRAPRNLNIPVNVQLWLFGWQPLARSPSQQNRLPSNVKTSRRQTIYDAMRVEPPSQI